MATVENPCATRISPKTKTGSKGKSAESEAVPGFTIKSRMKHVKVSFSCFALLIVSFQAYNTTATLILLMF